MSPQYDSESPVNVLGGGVVERPPITSSFVENVVGDKGEFKKAVGEITEIPEYSGLGDGGLRHGSVTTSAELRELTKAPAFRTNQHNNQEQYGTLEATTTNSDIDRNMDVLQREIRNLRQTMNDQIDSSCDMMVYKPQDDEQQLQQ